MNTEPDEEVKGVGNLLSVTIYVCGGLGQLPRLSILETVYGFSDFLSTPVSSILEVPLVVRIIEISTNRRRISVSGFNGSIRILKFLLSIKDLLEPISISQSRYLRSATTSLDNE